MTAKQLEQAAEMVLDWWHEWRTEAPEPEERVAFEALEAALQAGTEVAVKDDRLDHEKIPSWPPLKKALWNVVTGENLNDGHYINAYDLTDKLYAAALAQAGEESEPKPEPFAYVVFGEAEEKLSSLVKTQEDAEHTVGNLLRYRVGCTKAWFEPLYLAANPAAENPL